MPENVPKLPKTIDVRPCRCPSCKAYLSIRYIVKNRDNDGDFYYWHCPNWKKQNGECNLARGIDYEYDVYIELWYKFVYWNRMAHLKSMRSFKFGDEKKWEI